MQPANIKEYVLVRQEMITVKECITKYMGYVLGGSGAALFGLAALKYSSDNIIFLSYTSSMLSIIITFVLLILLYKFNSHNRYAGYCKLLNHERFNDKDKCVGIDLFAWEICIDRLRFSDLNADSLISLISNIETNELDEKNKKRLIMLLHEYSGRKPPIDNKKCRKGMKILFKAILGKSDSKSWGYPPFVVSLFFLLCAGFLTVGCYGTIFIFFQNNIEYAAKLSIMIVIATILVVQIYIWFCFSGKLYALMNGSSTVNGFFWRFMVIRAHFLNQYAIIPNFLYFDERLKEAMNELNGNG